MPTSSIVISKEMKKEEEEFENISKECKDLILSLPKEKGWRTSHLYFFQDFWCQPKEIQSIISFQTHFESKHDDIVLATIPKSGTTWLKALTFAIVNRKTHNVFDSTTHPLFSFNPHDLVPFFEYKLYANNTDNEDTHFLLPRYENGQPRVFATHLPYSSLKNSIDYSKNTRVVYLCRNPFDTFISSWHYSMKLRSDSCRHDSRETSSFSLEDYFDMYCKGVIGFGPFWDHMLGYWKESLARPDKVLFFKYEDMKKDIVSHLKTLAEFLGVPFSKEEEESMVVEEIARLCSFESLKELEVNKSGKSIKNFENKYLFRKGEVGDWKEYISPSMALKLSHVMEEKLGGSGLEFNLH